MKSILTVVKYTLKILLRNKGFLFFIFILPLLATIILNIQHIADEPILEDSDKIYSMDDMSERLCYMVTGMALPIKIYDETDGLGREVAKDLANQGIYQVFYVQVKEESQEEVEKSIQTSLEEDRVGGVIHIKSNLLEELREGSLKTSIVHYTSDSDPRMKQLEQSLSNLLGNYMQLAADTQEGNLVEQIEMIRTQYPEGKEVLIEDASSLALTQDQEEQSRNIGYFISIASISFLFVGVLIVDTIIQERHYKVFSRMQLTQLRPYEYIGAKYLVAVVSVFAELGVFAFCLRFLVKREYAIDNWKILLILLMVGITFSTLSMFVGIVANNVMNTCYIVFSIWSITSLLGGAYFDLSAAGPTMKGLSNLMPQKWALTVTKMMMQGQSKAYAVLLIAMLAYIVINSVLSVVGTVKTVQD